MENTQRYTFAASGANPLRWLVLPTGGGEDGEMMGCRGAGAGDAWVSVLRWAYSADTAWSGMWRLNWQWAWCRRRWRLHRCPMHGQRFTAPHTLEELFAT